MRHYIAEMPALELSPCQGCEVGYGGYSCGKDERGEFVEVSTCHDTCERLKDWAEKRYVRIGRSGMKEF